jgi:hypothetical protein
VSINVYSLQKWISGGAVYESYGRRRNSQFIPSKFQLCLPFQEKYLCVTLPEQLQVVIKEMFLCLINEATAHKDFSGSRGTAPAFSTCASDGG